MTSGGADMPGGAATPAALLQVFLSYSRPDRAKAQKVIAALEANGCEVWWDGLLTGGDAFAKTTETALETADAVVVLWSATSIQSHWVRDEATRGRDRGRMVPVSIDGTSPPLGFRQIQYIDLGKWRGKASAPEFTALLGAVRETARAPNTQLTFAQGAHPAMNPNRRRFLIGAGGSIAAVGGLFVAWRSGLFGGGAQANSLAVLPFRNLSNDAAQAYLSDGLSEELRSVLSSNPQLEVAAQTSSSSFGDKVATATQIASALKVAFVLEGSLQHVENQIRIALRLIDGKTGFETWSQRFDRKATDILAMQSEIALLVADQLAANLAGKVDKAGLRVGGTRNRDAFDAYLRGMALFRSAEGEVSDRAALKAFEAALGADPGYAAAHAARARVLTVIANSYSKGDGLREAYGRAIEAAEQAVKLAPGLAEGNAALGFALFSGRLDVRAAKAPYQKSFELGFGNADVLSAFATFAARTGNVADGRVAIERAKRLDPLNPSVFRNSGLLELAVRDLPAATAAFNAALRINPKTSGAHANLGDIALLSGNAAQARAEFIQEPNKLTRIRGLAIAEWKLGNRPAAEAHFAQLVADFGSNGYFQQAQVLAQWGRKEDALAALEAALAAGDTGLLLLRIDGLLDSLRSEERFKAVQTKMGFEVDIAA